MEGFFLTQFSPERRRPPYTAARRPAVALDRAPVIML